METNITVIKVNESYVKVICEKSTSQELSDYFTFFVPGFQFTPAYRNKTWDGKIRLMDSRSNNLYHGLLPYIEQFCTERGYILIYGDPRPDIIDEYSEYHADKFITNLNLHSKKQPIEIRDYQKKAYIHSMRNKRALLLSPTSSGKSLIVYLIVRQLLKYQNLKGLIVVPTTSLVEQLYSDFADYSTENGFDVSSNVHRIYQGKDKNPLKIKLSLNDGSVYIFDRNENMKLLNNVYKRAEDLDETDEIDDTWLRQYKKE